MNQVSQRAMRFGLVLTLLCGLALPQEARLDRSGDDATSESERAETPDASVTSPTASAAESPPWASPADDLTGRGLLDFRDPFPFAKLHLQLPASTPPGLAEGQTSALLQFDWANSAGSAQTFLVDAETYTLRFTLWHAFREELYLGVETAIEARDGGILDTLIDGFHDALNIQVAERDARPRGAYEIDVIDDGGQLKQLDRGVGLGNTALKAHWIFLKGREWWPTLSIQAIVDLPTSTSGFGARGVDLGMALMAQKKVWDHLYLYAIGGGTYLPDPTTEGLRYEDVNYQVTAGLEIVPWWDSLSLIGQYSYYSPLLEDKPVLDRERQYVSAAIKHRIHPRVNVIWGFTENLSPLRISADVTFTMGCELRF